MTLLAQHPQSDYKALKKESYMNIDLFLLHDDMLDNTPRKCIVASGKELNVEIQKHINNLLSKGWIKNELICYFSKTLNFSKGTCKQLVFVKKQYYHLIFLKELIKLDNTEHRFSVTELLEIAKHYRDKTEELE